MRRSRTVLVGAVLAASLAGEATVYAVLIRRVDLPSARLLVALAAPLWVLAVLSLAQLRAGRRTTAWLLLGVSLIFQLIALTHPPSTSDDANRYAWDAKVQLHGVDPYRYTPASPQLTRLRGSDLFGPPDHCQYHFPGGCTSMNRPTVHTIYPPVAEAAFALVRIVSFGSLGLRPLQVAAVLGSLLIGWLLLRWTAARGRPWLAAVWAWSPVMVTQYANDAHIDWLAILLVLVAFTTGVLRRTGWAGALVGAAIAVKLYPVLVLPSLMRRRPVLTVGSALAVVVLGYIPHVIAVGTAVIGYLPGYLKEENYSNGKRLLLLGSVLPHPFDTIVGALIVAAVGLWAWLRGDPVAPQRSAVIVVGVALLVFTPSYGWYTGLLLALVAMTGALEWVPLCFAGIYAFLVHTDHDTRTYLIAAIGVLVLAVARRLIEPRVGGPVPDSGPDPEADPTRRQAAPAG